MLGHVRADPTSCPPHGSHQQLQPPLRFSRARQRKAGRFHVPGKPSASTLTEDSPLQRCGPSRAPVSLETETSITCLDKLNDDHLASLFLKEPKGQCLLFQVTGCRDWGNEQRKPKDTIQNFQFCRVRLFTYSSNMSRM